MRAKRLYKGKDTDMLGSIRRIRNTFENDLADFTAFDPSLNAAFLANWKVIEQNAWLVEQDTEEISDGEILLQEAVTALEKCRQKYNDVKYYTGKAFPANKEALKEFGEGTYSKVRNSPLKMVQFMEALYGVATKYKTALIAQNYTQAAIDEIDALAAELRDDNNAQQLKKKERPTETRKRIEALNTYYGYGQRVVAVAPLVYRNEFVKRNMYLLAQRHHPKVAKAWLNVGTGALRKVAITKLLKKFKVSMTNQSPTGIEYRFTNNPKDTTGEKFFLAAGEETTLEPPVPVTKFLVLKNNGAKAARVMMAKQRLAD